MKSRCRSESDSEEKTIDRDYDTADLILPLSADSSQIVACLAAAQGRDFTLIGPPGTGKSQTIANIISILLSARKRVLFVAEKTAALDVVYRRLQERGLDDHCLELHSSKTDRKHFLAQLKRSWEQGSDPNAVDWITINNRLKLCRDQLNKYVEALHQPLRNGLTPYRALGIASSQINTHAPKLTWSGPNAHDKDTYVAMEELAAKLGLTFGAVKVKPVLHLVRVENWTSTWQEQLLNAAQTLGRAVNDIKLSLQRWSSSVGLDAARDTSRDGLKYYAELARNVVKTSGQNFDVILDRNFSILTTALSQLETAILSYREMEMRLSAPYPREEIARIPVEEIDRDWRAANAAMWPASWFAKRRIRKLLSTYAGAKSTDPTIDIALIRAMQSLTSDISNNEIVQTNLPVSGLDTDTAYLKMHLDLANQFRASIVQLGEFAGNIQGIASSIAASLTGQIVLPQVSAAEDFLQKFRVLAIAIDTFEAIAGASLPNDIGENFLTSVAGHMDDLSQARMMLRDWSSWCAVRTTAVAQGLGPLVDGLESGSVSADQALAAFRLGYARWWLPLVIDGNRELRDFRRFEHENTIVDFRVIDDLVRQNATTQVKKALLHNLPSASIVPRNSELGRLRHQMNLQRPSSSIRDMITALPGCFGKLAPCVLMSPLSIAQYLPANQELFDVVIFDEASQIATWDAVGAIARARQTIIVGDPKQLPPTNFFGRADNDEETPEFERDLESILDEVKASGLPSLKLRWHYRSRHESLIAFSNWHYYNNNLITFPSPVTQDQAVAMAYLPNGIYDRGKSRTNREEANAIARYAQNRLETWLGLPEDDRPTLGVITFNSQQMTLIQDLLDDIRREKPELEWFFSEDRFEPVIVKNLENIQGDERDVMLFSITFCKDAAGKMTMDFGALNRDGGERRLNVAITRARRELRVFSGTRADDIDLTRTKALGVTHLKAFLDYAVRGAVALPAQDTGSVGPIESPFEAGVVAALEGRGWHVGTQIGVSGFRIDLGIKHPDHAGSYLAGVECDGATYHSAATARDRDKIREQVLTNLGWTIFRVWSTDWWFNSEEAIHRLHQDLTKALTESRAKDQALGDNAVH